MKRFLEMLKLYSVQVIMFVGTLNTVLAVIPDVPWWAFAIVNVCGALAHHIARAAPQPELVARLDAMKK